MIFFRMFFGCLLQLAPFAFLCFYPFKDHLRFSARKVCVICGISFPLLAAFFAVTCCFLKTMLPPAQILFVSANMVFLFCLIPCVFLYWYLVREIWQKKLFIFSFTMTAALTMTSLDTILETWKQQNFSDGLPYNGTTLLTLAILTSVILPLLLLLLKRCYLPIANELDRRESGYLSLLSVFLFLLLGSGLIPIDYMNIFNPMTLFLYFALMFTIFIVYFICFRIFFLSHQNIKEMQALTQTQHQLEIQTEQYKRILETTENNRKMHHDLRHHILILQSLLDSGETEKASDYLQNYVQILRRYEVTKFCSHIVTNMIVSHYQSRALDKGITFTARINVPDSLMISDFDIAILLGNLLENAIESANHAKDHNRFISLNIICSGKMLAVTVDNGFNGCVNQNKGTYLSTKPHHTGIGLQSIAGIAKKYHGGVQFSHEGAIFHSSVMLSA